MGKAGEDLDLMTQAVRGHYFQYIAYFECLFVVSGTNVLLMQVQKDI